MQSAPDTRPELEKINKAFKAFNIGRIPLCLAAHLAGFCLSLVCIPKQETRRNPLNEGLQEKHAVRVIRAALRFASGIQKKQNKLKLLCTKI